MNRYKKLALDTLIVGIGTFGSKLLVFLLMPLYTAYLTTAQFGTAELITTTANLLIPVACLGISNGIFRFAAERESDRAAVFSSSMALLGGGTLLFLLLSPLLLLVEYLAKTVVLIVLYVLTANLQAVCAQYVRATDRMRLFALQGIFNTLLTVIFNVLFLTVWNLGVTGYVLSVILGNLITAVFLILYAKLYRMFRVRSIDRTLMKSLLLFSLPMIPTTVCWLITDLSDRYMVTYFCDANANGIYSAAYKIPTVVTLLSGIFLQAWQFSAVVQAKDENACRSFYSEVFRGFLSIVFIATACLIPASGLLATLLLNKSYWEAWYYMPTLLCAAAFEAIVSFLATVYMVRKKTIHSFLTALIGTGSNIFLNFLLIPQHGAIGAAVATLFAYSAVLILRLMDTPRLIRFRLYLTRLILSACFLIASAICMTSGETVGFFASVLLAVVIVFMNLPAVIDGIKRLFKHRKGA